MSSSSALAFATTEIPTAWHEGDRNPIRPGGSPSALVFIDQRRFCVRYVSDKTLILGILRLLRFAEPHKPLI